MPPFDAPLPGGSPPASAPPAGSHPGTPGWDKYIRAVWNEHFRDKYNPYTRSEVSETQETVRFLLSGDVPSGWVKCGTDSHFYGLWSRDWIKWCREYPSLTWRNYVHFKVTITFYWDTTWGTTTQTWTDEWYEATNTEKAEPGWVEERWVLESTGWGGTAGGQKDIGKGAKITLAGKIGEETTEGGRPPDDEPVPERDGLKKKAPKKKPKPVPYPDLRSESTPVESTSNPTFPDLEAVVEKALAGTFEVVEPEDIREATRQEPEVAFLDNLPYAVSRNKARLAELAARDIFLSPQEPSEGQDTKPNS